MVMVAVLMGMRVVMMMIVFVVGVLHSGRHRNLGRGLRIEQPPEQQHEQRAAQRE
jgi:hypothetical protein